MDASVPPPVFPVELPVKRRVGRQQKGTVKLLAREGKLAKIVLDDGRPLPLKWDGFLLSYLRNYCSLTQTAVQMNIPLGSVRRWIRDEPDFAEALKTIRQIMLDQIDQICARRALNPKEATTSWAQFYLRQHSEDRPTKRTKSKPVVFGDGTFERKR